MKLVFSIITIVIAIIVIVLGLIAYSYTQIHVSLNDVSLKSIDWESFSWSTLLKLGLNVLTGNWLGTAFDLIQGINLDLTFGLSNNGVLPVYIPDLSYDLWINGVSMGSGRSPINITINPGYTKEIIVSQKFQKDSLMPAIESIVRNDGIIELRVSGTAYFKLLGLNIPVPFESTKQVSIVDEIKNRLNGEIQKNQQESSNTLARSMGESLDNALNLAKNVINKVMNALDQPQQRSESETSKIQTQIYLENVKDTTEGRTVTFIGSLFYNKDGTLYGVPNAKVGVLADWQMPEQLPDQEPFVGFTYTDQYGKFKISWTAKENPLTRSGFVSTWSPRAYFLGNDRFEKSEGGMGLTSFQVTESPTSEQTIQNIAKSGDFVTIYTEHTDDGSTFLWTQIRGEKVELTPSRYIAEPTFRAPIVESGSEKVSFRVTITDYLGRTIVETIEVTVLPRG